MWTRKQLSSNQSTWAKPITSVAKCARQPLTRTLRNMQVERQDVQCATVDAAASDKREEQLKMGMILRAQSTRNDASGFYLFRFLDPFYDFLST